MDKLDHLNTQTYSVAFFCALADNIPPWSWIISSYYKLGRNMRKNMQALYVIHPSTWSKMLFQTMGYILSPKFTKKLKWIDCLESAAMSIPLGLLGIPEKILEYNHTLKIPAKPVIKLVFGQPLEHLMAANGMELPGIVTQCCEYVVENGAHLLIRIRQQRII